MSVNPHFILLSLLKFDENLILFGQKLNKFAPQKCPNFFFLLFFSFNIKAENHWSNQASQLLWVKPVTPREQWNVALLINWSNY